MKLSLKPPNRLSFSKSSKRRKLSPTPRSCQFSAISAACLSITSKLLCSVWLPCTRLVPRYYLLRHSHSSKELLKRIAEVSIDDMEDVGKRYLLPAFEATSSRTSVVCHPTKVEPLKSEFQASVWKLLPRYFGLFFTSYLYSWSCNNWRNRFFPSNIENYRRWATSSILCPVCRTTSCRLRISSIVGANEK